MSEERDIADEVNEKIREVFKGVDDEQNIRIAWIHATLGVQAIVMAAFQEGKKLESISISATDGGLEIQYTMVEQGSINSVSIEGVVSV